jgi:hypothetical protein
MVVHRESETKVSTISLGIVSNLLINPPKFCPFPVTLRAAIVAANPDKFVVERKLSAAFGQYFLLVVSRSKCNRGNLLKGASINSHRQLIARPSWAFESED